MSKQVDELLREYELKRNQKEGLRDKRVEEIYEKYPELKEIDEEMRSITYKSIIELASMITEHKDKEEFKDNKLQRKKELYEKLEKLKAKKKQIMKKNKIDANDFEVDYDCKNCKDTGYIVENGKRKRCKCFTQKLIEKSYEKSNLKRVVKNTFENFNLDYYSEEKKNGISPKEKVTNLYNDLIEYVENFEKIKNESHNSIMLTGKPGVGKTHLSEAVGNALIKNGYTVLYQTANNIFSKLVEYKFGEAKKYNDYIENIITVDLLIIDDLGIESINAPRIEEMFTIINERMIRNNPIIISTNLSIQDIINTYGDRIISRISGNSRMYKIDGEDIRVKNAKQRKV